MTETTYTHDVYVYVNWWEFALYAAGFVLFAILFISFINWLRKEN
jgi:hypothetical protein